MNRENLIKSPNLFVSSAKSLGSIKNICLCAMFLALAVVCEMFLVIQTPVLKISFTYLMFAVSGMMFGPVIGAIFGASVDLLGVLVNPAGGAVYLPLTVVAAISGFLYGLILYRKTPAQRATPLPLWRFVVAQAVNDLFCNTILNTACIAALMGKGFNEIVVMRLVKNFILLPFEIILLVFIVRIFEKIMKRFHRN